MKSFYLKMCKTTLNIIHRCRIPRRNHSKSSHIYSVWTHLILLVLRQYENKSYRRLTEFLEECARIQEYLVLTKVPHFTTLQKAAARLDGTALHKMPIELLLHRKARLVLAGIDGSGFSHAAASYCYTKRIQLRRGFLKVVVCADMNTQLICGAMIHHDMQHDNPDFLPLLRPVNDIIPTDVALGDMGFGDENNHAGAEQMKICGITPTRCVDVPVYRTGGIHRKGMKGNFPAQLYHHRNKSETVFFVTKQNDVWRHFIKECCNSGQ